MGNDKGASNKNADDAEIKQLKAKRARVKTQLTLFAKFLENQQGSNKIEVTQLKLRSANFEKLLTQFDEIQCLIEEITSTSDLDERQTFENNYYELLSTATELMNNMSIENSDNNNFEIKKSNPMQVRLPVLNIPNFSGNYSEWQNFYASFNSLIHENTELNNIQKLHYLKSSLKNEASKLIESLAITSENYELSLNLLRERFDNPRLIAQKHIQALFELPTVSKESPSSLQRLTDQLKLNIKALKAMGRPTEYWDDLIIFIVVSKFDYFTKREWENNIESTELPDMTQMSNFLTKRCQFLECLEVKTKLSKSNHPNNTIKSNYTRSACVAVQRDFNCWYCDSDHSIYRCSDFLKLSTESKLNEVKNRRLCVNCFKGNHKSSECRSSGCRTCRKKHNTMLHINQTENAQANIQPEPSTSSQVNITASVTNKGTHQVLLSTAIINVKNGDRKLISGRVLLDAGSQINLIRKSFCQQLGLKTQTTDLKISGINKSTNHVLSNCEVEIESKYNTYKTTISCFILPNITDNIPTVNFDRSLLAIPDNIQLADPWFDKSAEIDILLGAEMFWEVLANEQLKLGNKLYLQKTLFGWVAGGKLQNAVTGSKNKVCNLATNALEETLTKFWEVEEICPPIATKNYSLEEEECEKHFASTYKRNNDGRFIVKLPFKTNLQQLGHTRNIAFKRLKSVEAKFTKDISLKENYSKFLKEYELLQHMNLLRSPNDLNAVYFLPHHAVIKESSVSTRLRVVFDGSVKPHDGYSLNETLLTGPQLQQDLFSIITRFRTHQFVINADIKKMYRQILLDKNDRKFQCIFWRDGADQPVQVFQLNSVTYGLAPSSFLAVRCLHELAINERNNFPLASKTIINDFYTDDLFTGANSIEETITLRNEVTKILSKGGFELTKWCANAVELLPDQENKITTIQLNDPDHDNKTLGLMWNTSSDTFRFSINLEKGPTETKLTKRIILSMSAKLFDPLGLVGPVILTAKIMLQKLWMLKVNWDQPVSREISEVWNKYVKELVHLSELKIPRKIIATFPYKTIELHGFSDASESAYGACVYLRVKAEIGTNVARLITSKSRVAPLKKLSLPRLELCGALLLAKLIDKIANSIHLKIDQIYLWTDSTIVLAWLAGHPHQWKTFVGNRVSKIQNLTKKDDWYHVKSSENPADLVSRGCLPQQITINSMWWHGPHWLLENELPINKNLSGKSEVPEAKVICCVATTTSELQLFKKFSSFIKLVRVTAYCIRYIENVKNKNNKNTKGLSSAELEYSTNLLVRLCQQELFSKEIKQLTKHKTVDKQSKLFTLNAFIDKQGLIRVGGRIAKADVPMNAKFPVVLPKEHTLTKLIIRSYHIRYLHAGIQTTLAILRQKYWIIAGRDTVRQEIYRCVKCFRAKPKGINEMMGDLPKNRVNPARPFSNCGVDYAGPIDIKENSGRGRRIVKGYIALFVCMATKAIHLELVTSCTTEAFLATLKRVIARRGQMKNIFSDNGTNFKGASRELARMFKNSSFSQVTDYLASNETTWHFIPPRSPHIGGLWEAGVKSAKFHLKRVTNNALLTYEELYTLLAQIEAVLNSRPLTTLSSDPNDPAPITPGHFLIGSALSAPPEADLSDVPSNRLSRYQRVQQMRLHFWNRWRKEYLGSLQQRNKWASKAKRPVVIGDVVILKDDNAPPLVWPLGVVTDVHPGKDELIRVVSIKTREGTIVKRPITKVCLLPVEQ